MGDVSHRMFLPTTNRIILSWPVKTLRQICECLPVILFPAVSVSLPEAELPFTSGSVESDWLCCVVLPPGVVMVTMVGRAGRAGLTSNRASSSCISVTSLSVGAKRRHFNCTAEVMVAETTFGAYLFRI